jgi:hypothetical protein
MFIGFLDFSLYVIYPWVFLDFSVWVGVNFSFEWILAVSFCPDKLGKQKSGPARNTRGIIGLNSRISFPLIIWHIAVGVDMNV